MEDGATNGGPDLGRLPTLLQAGFFQMVDVSPESVAGYLKTLRELTPDQRIQAAARHTREALRALFAGAKMAEEDVPAYSAWRELAQKRYGTLPRALQSREPEYLYDFSTADLARMAAAVGFALEASGVRWCLSGVLARCAFGEPRPVSELEFVASLDEAALPALFKQLGDAFFAPPAPIKEAVEKREAVVLFHLASLTRIRIVPPSSELQVSGLERRVRVEGSACGRLWVMAPEDSVLQALTAWRDAEEGEEIHWRDLALLLAVQPRLDAAYLEAQAQKLELADTLREARTQAGAGGGS